MQESETEQRFLYREHFTTSLVDQIILFYFVSVHAKCLDTLNSCTFTSDSKKVIII